MGFLFTSSPIFAFAGVNCPAGFKYCDATLGEIITNLIKPIFIFASMLALLFLIWGGIRYMTARGDPKAVESARSALTSAIVGLLIILLSAVISFLVGAVFKINIFGYLATPAYAAPVDIGCAVKLGNQCIKFAFPTVGDFFTAIIRTALAAAAFIFFVMLLWGGFRYLNAGGDPKNADAARQTLTNAGIGLLIVIVSSVIIEIITRAVGAPSVFG